MNTEKLYYKDAYLAEFTTNVISCEQTEKGYEVILDATAFYPEGGGQPCDHGTLGDAKVLDVQERGGEVIHLCDKPLSGTVTGVIDWDRRFDLMQQHTGEHILSGVICKQYGANNVGFHIGAETVTIDFDVMIPPEDLEELEEKANTAIWGNAPVVCEYPTKEELENLPYRSKKALEGAVRIVSVPGYDCCACCGTHLKNSGQVGIIKILSAQKFHQGVRMEILCGKRAFAHYQKVWEQNKQVSAAFSAKPLETGAAAQRMNEALAQEKFRATGLQKKLLDMVAESYANRGDAVHFAEDLEPAQVRELADKIAHQCGGMAAVFCGSSFCLVSHKGDVKELGQKLCQEFNGRGGGKNGIFQGSLQAAQKDIEALLNAQFTMHNA
ncbi:MAG: alanyl-tRNA editing protein [Oscillospiraceae bacterium]|nr:alanyl-tRNA editing protein [Oscillospiraceae bacterium]